MRIAVTKHPASRAVELKQLIEAQRAGSTTLVTRDHEQRQRVFVIEEGDERLTIGRRPECDIVLDWDHQVSQVHAELVRIGGDWVIADDGLSRNGTFVNGERVSGRRRLRPGDTVLCGVSGLVFDRPRAEVPATVPDQALPDRIGLTPMQHKVLVALCRPYCTGTEFALPASNHAIADELVLSVETIKTHLRALYEKFGVDHLPQNEKRVRLAETALATGIVSAGDVGA